jgi:adenylate cyclase
VTDESLSLKEVAARADVSPATLRRWASSGVIPAMSGRPGERWTTPAAAHARVVARLRKRGHSLDEIRRAAQEGRLAYAFVEETFPPPGRRHTLREAAGESGLEPALIERFWASMGLPAADLDRLIDEDVEALRYAGSVLAAGFPLVAFLQLCRVYGQALAQIADAEIRLFHIYVHEPLMREELPGVAIAEEMENLARDLLPLASPLMDYAHLRFLQHYIEQDVVGHMEMEVDADADLGRLKVVIAFCDLAGYTRFTEEIGEVEALSFVERFVEAVSETLPEDARVIKTIGDEVMIIGQDVQALTDWAVGFQHLFRERPEPRIGIHYGSALYRDGDYFGREVNLAARVVARARGGEVLATGEVVQRVAESEHLAFEGVGQVKMKGFDEPVQLCRATMPG